MKASDLKLNVEFVRDEGESSTTENRRYIHRYIKKSIYSFN